MSGLMRIDEAWRTMTISFSSTKMGSKLSDWMLVNQNIQKKTNIKKLISPLFTGPQGFQGCQKMGQDPLNMPHEVWCANIAPKLKNIQKCLWKQGFFDDFSSILTVFCSLYNLRAILAQKENTFICRKKNVIFWHPWDPWGRINSGKNVFWVQTATVFWWQFRDTF